MLRFVFSNVVFRRTVIMSHEGLRRQLQNGSFADRLMIDPSSVNQVSQNFDDGDGDSLRARVCNRSQIAFQINEQNSQFWIKNWLSFSGSRNFTSQTSSCRVHVHIYVQYRIRCRTVRCAVCQCIPSSASSTYFTEFLSQKYTLFLVT